ncbi:MAG: hypothetical protein H8K07_11605 [Nitrospira sp.]|nr:hypothetical protein [Nitrospira sp.]MDI3464077.1 hypothetical protein [Nitrospira sp.]
MFRGGLLGSLVLGMSSCVTELPALVDQDQVAGNLVVGRVITVLTGERSRRYVPQMRFLELEDTDSRQRFQVDIESPDQRFAIDLPTGKYRLIRVQISEGPFMSIADLDMTFSVEADVITHVGTWRFGVDSPRYGRNVIVSMISEERAMARTFLNEQYPAFNENSMVERLPQPSQTETRLYEVMPYPRYSRYFRRHWW